MSAPQRHSKTQILSCDFLPDEWRCGAEIYNCPGALGEVVAPLVNSRVAPNGAAAGNPALRLAIVMAPRLTRASYCNSMRDWSLSSLIHTFSWYGARLATLPLTPSCVLMVEPTGNRSLSRRRACVK